MVMCLFTFRLVSRSGTVPRRYGELKDFYDVRSVLMEIIIRKIALDALVVHVLFDGITLPFVTDVAFLQKGIHANSFSSSRQGSNPVPTIRNRRVRTNTFPSIPYCTFRIRCRPCRKAESLPKRRACSIRRSRTLRNRRAVIRPWLSPFRNPSLLPRRRSRIPSTYRTGIACRLTRD